MCPACAQHTTSDHPTLQFRLNAHTKVTGIINEGQPLYDIEIVGNRAVTNACGTVHSITNTFFFG